MKMDEKETSSNTSDNSGKDTERMAFETPSQNMGTDTKASSAMDNSKRSLPPNKNTVGTEPAKHH
jgi:hypothetical protein